MIYIAFTYLLINAFLTGSLWDDIKIHEYSIRNMLGFIFCIIMFLLCALPIFIINDIAEFMHYKMGNNGIGTTNFLYVINKRFDKILNFIKRLTKTKLTHARNIFRSQKPSK